jgi:hypothetical protein
LPDPSACAGNQRDFSLQIHRRRSRTVTTVSCNSFHPIAESRGLRKMLFSARCEYYVP